MDQVFFTVGALVGPFPINQRASVTFGAGFQFAVARALTLDLMLTPAYQNALVFSARLGF